MTSTLSGNLTVQREVSECRGGLVIQRTMNATVVVIQAPTVDHPRALVQVQEQLSVQQLIAQLAVEALQPNTPMMEIRRLMTT